MTQETQQILDDEDQMAQALAELRSERTEAPDAVVEVKPEPAAAEVVVDPIEAEQKAPEEKPSPSPEDELKAAQAELHKMRSEIGRVGALNRKYMEAAQEAAALREQLAQSQRAPQSAAPSSAEMDAKLAAVAEQVKDFPELSGLVAAVGEALRQADKKTEEVARRVAAQAIEPLEPLRQEHMTRAEQERQAARSAALEQFNAVYPTAVNVIHSDDFQEWIKTQPGHIQFAFYKGQTPMDAMSVLDTYDMHLRRTGKEPIAQISNTRPDAAPAPAKSTNTSRLQRAAGIPSRPSGSQGSAPPADDFEASLAYFRNKRLSAQRAAV